MFVRVKRIYARQVEDEDIKKLLPGASQQHTEHSIPMARQVALPAQL